MEGATRRGEEEEEDLLINKNDISSGAAAGHRPRRVPFYFSVIPPMCPQIRQIANL